jgi:hypothetical protein
VPRERQRPTATGGLTPKPEALMPAGPPPVQTSAGPADLVWLSARVPRALRTALQHQAIHEGRSVAKLLADAVNAYLTEHSRT